MKKSLIELQHENKDYFFTIDEGFPLWKCRVSPFFENSKQANLWLKKYRMGKVQEIT
jgi:hypothetical protein